MILNRLFDPLWLDADVTLRGGGTAVLQEPLDKGDVIAVRLVDYYVKIRQAVLLNFGII